MKNYLKGDYFFPDILERSPILTSYNAGWSNINLEVQLQPPGETPEFCLDHDVVAINVGCGFQAEQILGDILKKTFFFTEQLSYAQDIATRFIGGITISAFFL